MASENVTLPQTLAFSGQAAAREFLVLRTVGACVVAGGAVWLGLADGVPMSVVLLGALLAAGGIYAWMRIGLRDARRAEGRKRSYLLLADDGLTVADGELTRFIAWQDLRALQIDEEKLAVEVATHEGDVLSIPAEYGNRGLLELHALLQDCARNRVDR